MTFDRGETIFSQGEPGDTMFLIQSGAVEISQFRNGQKTVLALLEYGDFFGEMALIDKHPRSATATAITRCCLLPFTRTSLMDRIRYDPGVVIHLLTTLTQRIAYTNRFLKTMFESDEDLRLALQDMQEGYAVAMQTPEDGNDTSAARGSAFETPVSTPASSEELRPLMDYRINREECVRFDTGDFICLEGEPGDSMFIIADGEVEISQGSGDDRFILARLYPGDFFGEMAIITDQPRTANAVSTRPSLLLPLQKDDFLVRIKTEPELALYILQGMIIRLRTMLTAVSDPKKTLSVAARNLFPPFTKRRRIRTSLVSLSTCGGCSAILLENQEELIRLLEKVKISYCPMLIDREEISEADVAIVDGVIRVKEDEEKVVEARNKSRYLIAWGTCAVFGGIPAFANHYELEDLIEESYGEAKDPFSYYLSGSRGIDWRTYQENHKELKLMRKAGKIDDFVCVDYYLPGCPPNVSLLNELVSELTGGKIKLKPRPIVCTECSRKHLKTAVKHIWVSPRPEWEAAHCFTSRGSICMGFVTKGGCGAICPRAGLACWGCRGPSEAALKRMEGGDSFEDYMVSSFLSRNPGMEDEIKSVLRIFRKHGSNSLKFSQNFIKHLSRIR
ncbi:MAG: cyclic nucleotide-binding domain-containing protein [Nitrospirota bacterium]